MDTSSKLGSFLEKRLNLHLFWYRSVLVGEVIDVVLYAECIGEVRAGSTHEEKSPYPGYIAGRENRVENLQTLHGASETRD